MFNFMYHVVSLKLLEKVRKSETEEKPKPFRNQGMKWEHGQLSVT